MRLELLPLLACPDCGGDIRFSSLPHMPIGEEVESGALACQSCAAEYSIRGGVPRLRPHAAKESRAERTRRSFSWRRRSLSFRSRDRGIFLEETMIPPETFAGKTVLDAGCGMGRYSVAALSLGAEVIALDISDGLDRVIEFARESPHLHPVEGDLLCPPLKKASFDIVYSQGALHSTADAEAAFKTISTLVKPRGLLSVWIYGKAGDFADFKTNPLKPGRYWLGSHRRIAWHIVKIRHFFSDALRLLTTRLPVPVVYVLCYPLAALGAVPGLKHLTFSADPEFRARVLENFDWLAPSYQRRYTKEDLALWFQESGFEILSILPHGFVPKPGILGRKFR